MGILTQPFDYSLNALDPVAALQSGMAFGQQQRAGEQAMDMNAQNMQLAQSQEQRAQTAFGQQNTLFDQQQQDRAAAQERAKALNADLVALSERVAAGQVTADDFGAMAAKYPDLADDMGKMWEGRTKERVETDKAELYKGIMAIKAGRPDLALQMLEDRAVAAENSGDQMEADIARATAESIKADPNSALTLLGMTLHGIDPDAAEAVFGKGRSVQSTNAYANGTTVTVFTDGTKEVTDGAGTVLSGANAQTAIDAANASEAAARGANAGAAEGAKLDARIDKGGTAAASEEAGKVAVTASKEAYDSLQKVRKNIANVQTAIDAIDSGADAGAIQKYFPDITTASASLTNAMNQLGLDVIGSVTFGALSEGEMKLAMETAVPRNLDAPQLREWLVAKKAAQEKAAAALREAAIYLGQPGNTLATYLQEQGVSGAVGSGSPTPTFDQSEIDQLLLGP